MKKSINIHLCLSNNTFETSTLMTSMAPVESHIVISYTGTTNVAQEQARELKTSLIEKLLWLLPDCGIKNIDDAVSATTQQQYTSANQPWKDCKNKILVIVGDSLNGTPNTEPMELNGFNHLPVFQAKRNEDGSLPNVVLAKQYSAYNAEWWEENIREAVPRLLGMLKMIPEELKIFISYKRSDTKKIAEQLYDALQHKGAEVFLDSFTIPSGVNFQRRLAQQLSDKAMVVILESPNLSESPWVQRELSFAKIYRLGFCALHFGAPGKHELKQVDTDNRYPLDNADYIDSSIGMDKRELTETSLQKLVQFIKDKHAIALINKHRYLRGSLEKLLGEITPVSDENGYLDITTPSTHYKVALHVRPGEAREYFYLYSAASDKTPLRRVIIGPLLHLQERKQINKWLSSRSGIHFYDEGRLMDFVNDVKSNP